MDVSGDVFCGLRKQRVVEIQHTAVNFGNVNICPGVQTTPAPCSQTLTLTYNINNSVTLGSAATVVTQGTPNLDFTSSAATCTGSQSASSSCSVTVSFAPQAPGARMGAVQLTDNLGNVLVTTMLHGQGQGPAITFGPGTQTTPATGLTNSQGVAVDAAGDLFIANSGSNQVVEIPTGGGSQLTLGSGRVPPWD